MDRPAGRLKKRQRTAAGEAAPARRDWEPLDNWTAGRIFGRRDPEDHTDLDWLYAGTTG